MRAAGDKWGREASRAETDMRAQSLQVLLLTARQGLLSVLGDQAPQLIPADAKKVRSGRRHGHGTCASWGGTCSGPGSQSCGSRPWGTWARCPVSHLW